MIHDRQAVAKGLCFVHVVRGQDHGPSFGFDLPDHLPKALPGLGIKARGGLIQEHQFRVVHQRHGQRQPLHLATTQRDVVGVGFVRELHQLQ